MNTLFESNLRLLAARFPEVASMLDGFDPDSVGIGATPDGGYCYAVRGLDGGWEPFTPADAPVSLAREALRPMEERLCEGLDPAVVVGLNPGILLDFVFTHFKEFAAQNNPFRRVHVLVDSRRSLAGWLKASDRSEVLQSPAVAFHRVEDAGRIAAQCEADPNLSHQFIPVSTLPAARVSRAMRPLAALFHRRKLEERRMAAANEAYYDAMADEALARAIAGQAGRKPRALVPAHLFSTVVRYAARDLCDSLASAGWEAVFLGIEDELTSWRLVKAIHDLKPDIMIWINHLRTEDAKFDIIPKNLFYITWVQDHQWDIVTRRECGRWLAHALASLPGGGVRRRDLIIGYVDMLPSFGYPPDRLVHVVTPASPSMLGGSSTRPEYACEVNFCSNRSEIPEEVVDKRLAPMFEGRGLSAAVLRDCHDVLRALYRSGGALHNPESFTAHLAGRVPAFAAAFDSMDADSRNVASQQLFWILNDLLYRQETVRWLLALGADVRLFGKGWEANPEFAPYAGGVLPHGPELGMAYRSAKFCLHLNVMEGYHQRVAEILVAGGRILTRRSPANPFMPAPLASALRKAGLALAGGAALGGTDFEASLAADEREAFADWAFGTALSLASSHPDADALALALAERVRLAQESLDVMIPDFPSHCFSTPSELAMRLGRACPPELAAVGRKEAGHDA